MAFTKEMPPPTATPAVFKPPSAQAESHDRLQEWFAAHSSLVVFMILACGFFWRAWTAWGTFFNPDEAQHVLLADRATWAASYKASLVTAHPPGLIFVLYGWNEIGGSEFWLRLPSVIAGTVFCWLAFRWLRVLCGQTVAWIGLLFFAFLPPLITLSAEVRQYALMLAFCAASAYFLESSLARNSAIRMLWSGVWLLGAMTFHYSAFLFAAAVGTYTLLRLIVDRQPVRVFLAWIIGQAAGLALGRFFYQSQLLQLANDPNGQGTQHWIDSYLHNVFFHAGEDSAAHFIFARTFGVFQFLFGQLAVGDVACVLFIGAIVWLLWSRGLQSQVATRRRLTAVLLTLPFVLNCSAALLDKYPYGGTRHSTFLSLFALAGVSLAIATVTRQKLARALVVAVMILLACHLFGKPRRPFILRADQQVENMDQALAVIRTLPASDPILLDGQSNLMLQHYLCEGELAIGDTPVPGLKHFHCGMYQFYGAGANTPVFTVQSFAQRWQELIERYALKPGTTVHVVQMGWDVDLADQLLKSDEFHDLEVERFGKNIVIFTLDAGHPMP